MINIATRLVAILTSLRHAIAAYTAQQNRGQTITWLGTQAYRPIESPNQPPKLPTETWVLLWHRLNRMANRFQTLFTRWQTGALPARHRHSERSETPTRPTSPIPRLPAKPGWVNARIAEAAPCAGTLDYLLQDPELPRFLAAAPQAGRLLRPLCHALGIPAPDWLKLPPRPPKPKPQLLSPRPARGEPEGGVGFPPPTPDRPIPRNIRAAARAWKKYDK